MKSKQRERFERDPEITGQVERLVSIIQNKERGQTLSWSEITESVGLHRNHSRTRHVLGRARTEVRKGPHGLVIKWNHNARAFDILTPEDQINRVFDERSRKACRQGTMLVNEIGATPEDGLTAHQRQKKYVHIEQGEELRLHAMRSRRISKAITATTETLPQRPRDA